MAGAKLVQPFQVVARKRSRAAPNSLVAGELVNMLDIDVKVSEPQAVEAINQPSEGLATGYPITGDIEHESPVVNHRPVAYQNAACRPIQASDRFKELRRISTAFIRPVANLDTSVIDS